MALASAASSRRPLVELLRESKGGRHSHRWRTPFELLKTWGAATIPAQTG
eukprot:CAMPEP_0204571254 /NCGR_PEP_ID=MMETSP0661-20131031/38788_1 /ASSEMBLY_ACC=CAM_ASM_000606 /TAXON_ID=109239 /ORGANISM="Alexandrium margalefi, Strain AMGDE01CS-322" /LENGTH=49 /DNA_ID= /DNA_START= /DNA_END= /DNA_ORIENTATION=